jgi:hypothetical protein
MKTIEDYEIELELKISQAIDGMGLFRENIEHLGLIIKKDPRYIYDILDSRLSALTQEYRGTTLRNSEIFEHWISRIDLILNVLSEVRNNINNVIQASTIQDSNTVSQISEWFDSLAESAEGIFEQSALVVKEKTGLEINVVKAAMVGGIGYIVLRKMNLGQLESMLIAGTVAYILGRR